MEVKFVILIKIKDFKNFSTKTIKNELFIDKNVALFIFLDIIT